MGGGLFRPMWSDGTSDNDVDPDAFLASFESIYRTQPVLAGAIDKISRRVASLPFDAYRRLANDGREVVKGDALDSLIRRPIPGWTGLHLLAFIQQSMLVHGNAIVAKLRTSDREAPPFMLWPLDWSMLSAYGPQGGRIEWWSTAQFDGEERFLAAEDVMHFAWPSPSGSQIGVSALEKLGVTVRLEAAAVTHQTSMFRNGSRPSLAVSLGPNAKTKDIETARESIERLHKGPSQSGRTLLMGGDVSVETLSLTPVEVELIDQRRLNREDVGMVLDLAGPLMNDLTHGTYSNVEELNRGLYRDVLPPWLGLISDTFQAQLLDPEPAWLDRFVAFDLTDKTKGDPEALAASLKLQVEAGLVTRNEARRILNMPPIGDPKDTTNPANQLTANVNNQGALDDLSNGTTPTAPAA
jgi:HK97 family phage portal protein